MDLKWAWGSPSSLRIQGYFQNVTGLNFKLFNNYAWNHEAAVSAQPCIKILDAGIFHANMKNLAWIKLILPADQHRQLNTIVF